MIPAVLVIDDSLTVRMDLAEHFAAAGFAVTTCATLAAAREALAAAAFALVVLDVQFPDGDGIGLLRALRDDPLTAILPVMILSGEAEVRDRVRGLRTGADDYVGKPYDPAYVVNRARTLVAARQPIAARVATVLVIDDSATFRARFAAELRAAGLTVVVAASGEEGLARAAAQRPAVAVVDRMLPGIDGLTVIRRLRQDRAMRLTACLLLTASDAPDEELRALEA
nr:response regulator [Planctomycetota bacterium]